MKKIFLIVFVALTLQSYGQKTAFINESKLLEATPGYTKATEEMTELKKNYDKELQEANENLQTKINNLLKNYKITEQTTQEQLEALLSENDKAQFALIKEERELLTKQITLKEKAYAALYQEKVGKILENLNKTIQDYCKRNKIEILYKRDVLSNGIAYIEDKLDITEAVIALVKK